MRPFLSGRGFLWISLSSFLTKQFLSGSPPLLRVSVFWCARPQNIKEQLGACPLFDAVVYAALVSTPGLVYMKEGDAMQI